MCYWLIFIVVNSKCNNKTPLRWMSVTCDNLHWSCRNQCFTRKKYNKQTLVDIWKLEFFISMKRKQTKKCNRTQNNTKIQRYSNKRHKHIHYVCIRSKYFHCFYSLMPHVFLPLVDWKTEFWRFLESIQL